MKHIFTVIIFGIFLHSSLLAETIKFELNQNMLSLCFTQTPNDEISQETLHNFDLCMQCIKQLDKVIALNIIHGNTQSLEWLLRWLPKLPSLTWLDLDSTISGEQLINCLSALPAPEKMMVFNATSTDLSVIDIKTFIAAINKLTALKSINLNHVGLSDAQIEPLIHKVQQTVRILINQNNELRCYKNGKQDHQREDMFD